MTISIDLVINWIRQSNPYLFKYYFHRWNASSFIKYFSSMSSHESIDVKNLLIQRQSDQLISIGILEFKIFLFERLQIFRWKKKNENNNVFSERIHDFIIICTSVKDFWWDDLRRLRSCMTLQSSITDHEKGNDDL